MSSWINFKPGDKHPTGWARVQIKMSQPGLYNRGHAMSFDWGISEEDDMGTRIIAYRCIKENEIPAEDYPEKVKKEPKTSKKDRVNEIFREFLALKTLMEPLFEEIRGINRRDARTALEEMQDQIEAMSQE